MKFVVRKKIKIIRIIIQKLGIYSCNSLNSLSIVVPVVSLPFVEIRFIRVRHNHLRAGTSAPPLRYRRANPHSWRFVLFVFVIIIRVISVIRCWKNFVPIREIGVRKAVYARHSPPTISDGFSLRNYGGAKSQITFSRKPFPRIHRTNKKLYKTCV